MLGWWLDFAASSKLPIVEVVGGYCLSRSRDREYSPYLERRDGSRVGGGVRGGLRRDRMGEEELCRDGDR